MTLLLALLFTLPIVLPLLVPAGLVGFATASGFLALAVLWHLLFAFLVWPWKEPC